MEFHDNYPQYELMAHHSEAEGKVKRKKLWGVFWLLLFVTIVEVVVGFFAAQLGISKLVLKVLFIGLTLVKAAFIVLTFMHLGDENKSFKYTVLTPFTLFILYLIYICLAEGTFNGGLKAPMDKNIVEQQENLRKGHHVGSTHHDEVKDLK